jgi:hypothetical protein
VGAALPRRNCRDRADTRVKRPRARPPATPEEALKGLPLSVEQTGTLISGMLEIRAEVLDYKGLARASPNLKERLLSLKLARTALANLTNAFATPFCNDVIEAMDEDQPPRRLNLSSRPRVKRRSVQFLELLPVVKRYIDDMTADDIRKRWSDGSDRRTVNLECLDYETDAVFDLVQKAGFALGEPGGQTLELIRCLFTFTGGKAVGISMARKRLKAWKTLGKQNVYAFHEE